MSLQDMHISLRTSRCLRIFNAECQISALGRAQPARARRSARGERSELMQSDAKAGRRRPSISELNKRVCKSGERGARGTRPPASERPAALVVRAGLIRWRRPELVVWRSIGRRPRAELIRADSVCGHACSSPLSSGWQARARRAPLSSGTRI
jgi:hypothetical protein